MLYLLLLLTAASVLITATFLWAILSGLSQAHESKKGQSK